MKYIIFCLLLAGIVSCSPSSQKKEIVNQETKHEQKTDSSSVPSENTYQNFLLSEHTLDTFSIPFRKESMLTPLSGYYNSYSVKERIGQQDGPDFTYFEITKDSSMPIVYLNFDSENKLHLDDITIVSPMAVDQFGIHVGDPLTKVIASRDTGQIIFDPYHFHIYYAYENSNIFYELEGELHTPDASNIEDITLTYNDISSHTIQSIIWRDRQ